MIHFEMIDGLCNRNFKIAKLLIASKLHRKPLQAMTTYIQLKNNLLPHINT